jgi:hypothetical protein
VSASTVGYFEAGNRRSVLDVSIVQRVLEAAGVEFIGGAPGVKLSGAGEIIPADKFSASNDD